jgi:hypothetical protein
MIIDVTLSSTKRKNIPAKSYRNLPLKKYFTYFQQRLNLPLEAVLHKVFRQSHPHDFPLDNAADTRWYPVPLRGEMLFLPELAPRQ